MSPVQLAPSARRFAEVGTPQPTGNVTTIVSPGARSVSSVMSMLRSLVADASVTLAVTPVTMSAYAGSVRARRSPIVASSTAAIRHGRNWRRARNT